MYFDERFIFVCLQNSVEAMKPQDHISSRALAKNQQVGGEFYFKNHL